MAYPIKLAKPEGARRLELLKGVERLERIEMAAMTSETEREDLRWLWRAGLIHVVGGAQPLQYALTGHGALTLQGEAAERAKIKAKEAKAA